MKNYKQEALDLIKSFESNSYFFHGGNVEGFSIMLYQDAHKVIFGKNLGSFSVPTKKEATEMMHKLSQYYKALCEASPEFAQYVNGKIFEVELVVFSGHMDFSVAKMVGEEIVWYSDLK